MAITMDDVLGFFGNVKDSLNEAGQRMAIDAYARRHPELGVMPQVQESAYRNALQQNPSVDLAEMTPKSILDDPYINGWLGGGTINAVGRNAMDAIVQAANVVKPKMVPTDKPILREILPDSPDMLRGMRGAFGNKVSEDDLWNAISNRQRLLSEAPTTPGAKASEEEWAKWGADHGVNMTVTQPQSLGISDALNRKEIMVPGGLEGKFTIPDLFWIKANNFDPNALPKDLHDQLMLKFLRTHKIDNPDAVDTFNRLSFAQLSPNAPLTANEFLAQRLRAVDLNDLKNYATRQGEPGLSDSLTWESGVGGAPRTGGMGVKGTAELSNLSDLAALILSKPEMFTPVGNETIRDMTTRVMNQVPGLGTKTGSLATPWLDLDRANVSAIDLWGIRNTWKRLLDDPEVGPAMVTKIGSRIGLKDPTPQSILSYVDSSPGAAKAAEKAAIGVVAAPTRAKYRMATGEINPKVPDSVMPDQLAYEPSHFQDFGPTYKAAMRLLDEERGANPVLEMFPEQWRKWDRYRGRVEPHEFAHPDFRLLPKQSFEEMQAARQAHSRAGYMAAPKAGETSARLPRQSDWRSLYYGNANPELLTALGVGGLAALFGLNRGQQ